MKVGLVLEGGGMRGMYTAGVLDMFLDNNIKIDGIIGVSAGVLFGVNYCSKQRGRAIRYNKKYAGNKNYMSIYSLLTTGNIVNKDFAYYDVPLKHDIFDIAFLLAHLFAQVLHILARTDGIHHIIGFYLILTCRDDSLLFAFDSHYAVEAMIEESRHKWFANHFCSLAHFQYT